MTDERFEKQLNFLTEMDKMKTILRKNIIIDKTKNEDDAEHSWHMALFAVTLFEYADPGVDLLRAVKMALVHDLVETYAGDTFCFDEAANESKELREAQAADRVFGLLPAEQGAEFRRLWEEFDRMDTPDALYAAAMDRLQPFILNYNTDGHTWKLGAVREDQVYRRLEPVRAALPALWGTIDKMVRACIEKGLIRAS